MAATCHRLLRFKNLSRAKRLGLVTMATMGVTYWYYKPFRNNPVPPVPYIPPPFVWESIPQPIRRRFVTETTLTERYDRADEAIVHKDHKLPTTPTIATNEETNNNMVWTVMTAAVIGSIGTLSKIFLNYFSDTKIYGLEQFLDMLQDPERKRGIITVSNHESVLDDPVLWGVLPLHILFSPEKMRWVLGAADICYTSIFRSYFFVFGRTIPTIRGAGIYQPAVDFAIHHLQNDKGWVHIYPEAKVTQDNFGKMIRFKWGIGRILMDITTKEEGQEEEEEPVIVIPIWHKGMHLAKPLYGTKLVHVGKPIKIVYGDPVPYADILKAWKTGQLTREETRIQLTQRMYDALEKMREEYDDDV